MFEFDNTLTELHVRGGYQLIVKWHYNATDFHNGIGRVAIRHPRNGGYGNYFREIGPETDFLINKGMLFNEISTVARNWLIEHKDEYIDFYLRSRRMTVRKCYAVWNKSNHNWQSVPDIVPSIPLDRQLWSRANAEQILERDAENYAYEGLYASVNEAREDMCVRVYPLEGGVSNGR